MTLLEVMVVVAIIGMLSSISIVSFVQYKQSTALESAAEEVLAVLREAQNYALSGKNIDPNCANYRVFPGTFPNNNRYFLRNPACNNVDNTYYLKNGVTFSSTNGVAFRAPHANLVTNATTGNSLTITNGTNSYNICVNDSGLITKNFNSACP